MLLTETEQFRQSGLLSQTKENENAKYWKNQYEKLQKNTLTQMQTIERQQKRIAQLEESLAMALSENGQLRDLTEELMKQRNELEESLTGVKSSARPLVTALNSLGLSVSEVD